MADHANPSRNQDAPRGPGQDGGADPPDTPSLTRDEAARAAGGNLVSHDTDTGPSRGDPQPGPRRAAQGVEPTSAEAVVPALKADSRITKGGDATEPLSALRAAAAATERELDPGAYEQFLAHHPGSWPSAAELAQRYGSFAAAVEAAGVLGPSADRDA